MNDKVLLQNIFCEMLRTRMVEEEIAVRYSEQKMRCPTHLSVGQEAVSAVVGAFLEKTDLAVSSHRAHAHYLAKGGSLNALIAELHGRQTGCTHGRGGSMNLSDRSVGFVASTAIVANTIPIGVGLAFAQQLKKTNKRVVIFLGDAAVEEGVFYESLNFAVLRKLPVIFICENNLYSVNSPFHLRQPADRKIYNMVQGIGARTESFDGNDVLSMYARVREIFQSFREGEHPWFLEFATYRYKVHCGPQDDFDYNARPKEEVDYWHSRDPLFMAQKAFLSASIIDEKQIESWRASIQAEIDQAFDVAISSEFPSLADCQKDKYAQSDVEWLQKMLSEQQEEVFLGQ